jgi:hypothetical protein
MHPTVGHRWQQLRPMAVHLGQTLLEKASLFGPRDVCMDTRLGIVILRLGTRLLEAGVDALDAVMQTMQLF